MHLLAAGAPVAAAQAPRDTVSPRIGILAGERVWNNAIVRKNTAVVGALLSDDFIHIAHNGYQARRAELPRAVADAGTTLEPMLTHGVTVRAYANTVVVTGWFRQAGISGGGNFETYMRYTDVHARDGGRRRAASAVSAHASTLGRRSGK